jgi:AmmeMemoRadiSam system protein B
MRVRPPAVAGSWYPGTRAALDNAVDGYLRDAADERDVGCPRAIVAPHAGLMYSGPVAAYAYGLLKGCSYEAAVLVGPSHFVGFDGVSLWPEGAWDTPHGPIPISAGVAAAIAAADTDLARRSPGGAKAALSDFPAAHRREHSLEMQLPFLARLLPDVPIVPMVMGYQTRATADRLGDALAQALRGRNVLLVASSDLSHYNDARTAARMDAVVARHVDAFDPEALMDALEREPGHACGGGPIVSVLRAARALGATEARVLRYADSGDVSGDKSAVVGYLAAAIW